MAKILSFSINAITNEFNNQLRLRKEVAGTDSILCQSKNEYKVIVTIALNEALKRVNFDIV